MQSKQRFEIVPTFPNIIAVNGVFYGEKIKNLNIEENDSIKCSCIFVTRPINSIIPVSLSTVIGNGSLIDIGCIRFVFATSDYVPMNEWSEFN